MNFQSMRNMFQGPQQGRDGEAELELFYMQSHGRRVARIHMHDWLILILLAIIDIGLNVIHPFCRFVGKDMMSDFKYPLKENTVPFWAVPIYAVILPIVVFLFIYIRRRDVHDLRHAILGYPGMPKMLAPPGAPSILGQLNPSFHGQVNNDVPKPNTMNPPMMVPGSSRAPTSGLSLQMLTPDDVEQYLVFLKAVS